MQCSLSFILNNIASCSYLLKTWFLSFNCVKNLETLKSHLNKIVSSSLKRWGSLMIQSSSLPSRLWGMKWNELTVFKAAQAELLLLLPSFSNRLIKIIKEIQLKSFQNKETIFLHTKTCSMLKDFTGRADVFSQLFWNRSKTHGDPRKSNFENLSNSITLVS